MLRQRNPTDRSLKENQNLISGHNSKNDACNYGRCDTGKKIPQCWNDEKLIYPFRYQDVGQCYQMTLKPIFDPIWMNFLVKCYLIYA